MKKELTGKERRVRQLLVWVPMVVVPLVTMLFWVAGGGRGQAAVLEVTGFLKRLPAPYVDPITRLDKMGYYDLARRDSMAERQKLGIQESYARQLGLESVAGAGSRIDENVVRVREKLEELKRAVRSSGARAVGVARVGVAAAVPGVALVPSGVAAAAAEPAGGVAAAAPSRVTGPAVGPVGHAGFAASGDAAMMSPLVRRVGVFDRDEGGNAEIRELTNVVEKLLALQRGKDVPGRALEGVRSADGVRPAEGLRSVDGVRSAEGVRLREVAAMELKALPADGDSVGGFDSNRIEAVVPEEQVLVSGGELRLELMTDVEIGRQRVPAGTALFGTVALSGERLRVEIVAVAVDGKVLPVRLEVCDADGMTGIYVPGAPVSEALRESAGQEMGALGSGLVSTSVAGQAAGAGVVLARSLIGKKVRAVRVTIPAGYRVLVNLKNVGL
jgi:hypothetical protein